MAETEQASRTRAPLSAQAKSHVALRRSLLRAQPELMKLVGPDPLSVLGAFAVLFVHWTAIWLVAQTNVWVVFFAAFFFGQVTLHAGGGLIHETAHRLIFRSRGAKLAFDLLLEVIGTSFGRQLVYQHEHLSSHHPYMGDYERDYEHEDVCRFLARREYRGKHSALQPAIAAAQLIVDLLPLGFLVSGEMFARLYGRLTGRAPKDKRRVIGATKPQAWETALFVAVSLATNVFLYLWVGALGVLYHIWSLSLFLGKCGVTNLGQSLSEHPGDDEAHPTRSTYWWGNKILFNTGYHHEHHTFPNVAWRNLPKLKAMAPEAFNLESKRSYIRCWWDHTRAGFDLPSRRNAYQNQPQTERCAAS
jgi:sphingolipid delta-4 desaturase